MNKSDEFYMKRALELALCARDHNEVPVGAVIVLHDNIIGEGWNKPIQTSDPTAHAEIVALRQASFHLANYRLLETTLYVTLEPCAMCIGAMLHARIKRLVFGALDLKSGAVKSVFHLLDKPTLNHRISYDHGILSDECGVLLSNFFKSRR